MESSGTIVKDYKSENYLILSFKMSRDCKSGLTSYGTQFYSELTYPDPDKLEL